tara:strand:- start:414 stop:1379 length:966 start_codon:yes stop_codon:yes gene_type:complete
MKKILIFKTDRVGDLINITSIINNIKLNYPDSEIDIVCSKYNSQFANYISDLNNILIFESTLIKFLYVNFKSILSNKYDLIFQLDGKNHSYLLSILFSAKKKYSLKFIKQKKILGYFLNINRPNLIYSKFIETIECYENYNLQNNKSYHYLTLYLKLLELANFKIFDNSHHFKFNPTIKVVNFENDYIHFHIDEKWKFFNKNIHDNFIELFSKFSSKKNIVLTSNLGKNDLYEKLYEKFFNNKNFEFIKSPNFSELISIVYFAKTCVSSHSGFIVHLAACYKKSIIDIVPKNIFNELDRWIPFNINYKRYDICDIKSVSFD